MLPAERISSTNIRTAMSDLTLRKCIYMSFSPSKSDQGPGKRRGGAAGSSRGASPAGSNTSANRNGNAAETSVAPEIAGRGATVREVAAAAGVSIGTVSRYLNGRSLMQDTRVKVEEGIRKTGYGSVPETVPRKSQKTLTIGAVFPNFDVFHVNMLSALEKLVLRRGYHVMTCDYENDEATMKEELSLLRSRGVDGIVCSPVKSTFSVLRGNLVTGLPVVTFNNRVDAWGNDHVSVDDRNATARAVRYMIDMGHERIAIVGGDPGTSTGWNRLQGYRDALFEAGIAERRAYMVGGHWPVASASPDIVRSLFELKTPPTAVFAANYKLGYGVLSYCRDNGVRIPDDVSIIVFDDTDVFQLHSPPITVLRQPMELVAEEAATLMFQRIEGNYEEYPQRRVVSTEMILRESVRKIG
ncbi:MAG: LacI family DNA-binding transcriptional regulator [Spirochaetia bacterium]